MILVDGEKYACIKCIRGHRSSSCQHTGRPLVQVRQRGRPSVSGCAHRVVIIADKKSIQKTESRLVEAPGDDSAALSDPPVKKEFSGHGMPRSGRDKRTEKPIEKVEKVEKVEKSEKAEKPTEPLANTVKPRSCCGGTKPETETKPEPCYCSDSGDCRCDHNGTVSGLKTGTEDCHKPELDPGTNTSRISSSSSSSASSSSSSSSASSSTTARNTPANVIINLKASHKQLVDTGGTNFDILHDAEDSGIPGQPFVPDLLTPSLSGSSAGHSASRPASPCCSAPPVEPSSQRGCGCGCKSGGPSRSRSLQPSCCIKIAVSTQKIIKANPMTLRKAAANKNDLVFVSFNPGGNKQKDRKPIVASSEPSKTIRSPQTAEQLGLSAGIPASAANSSDSTNMFSQCAFTFPPLSTGYQPLSSSTGASESLSGDIQGDFHMREPANTQFGVSAPIRSDSGMSTGLEMMDLNRVGPSISSGDLAGESANGLTSVDSMNQFFDGLEAPVGHNFGTQLGPQIGTQVAWPGNQSIVDPSGIPTALSAPERSPASSQSPGETYDVFFASPCVLPGGCCCGDLCGCEGCPVHDPRVKEHVPEELAKVLQAQQADGSAVSSLFDELDNYGWGEM